jgi:protein-disulfide isomerase
MRKRFSLLLISLFAVCAAFAQTKVTTAKTIASKAPATFTLPARAAGSKDAPVVIEVFTDFQCPGCREYYLRTLRRVIDEYCLTGKVYLIHHDFPLPQHPYSKAAARWAVAASSVGKYESVTEALFTKQDVWGANGNIEAVLRPVLSPDEMIKVKAILVDHLTAVDAEIDKDVALARDVKVQETPSTKVTKKGKEIAPLTPKVIDYAIMKRFLDDQLKAN